MNNYVNTGAYTIENIGRRDFDTDPGGSTEHEIIFSPGKEELIFPSASEIYDAVFENSFHPAFIASGSGQILKVNQKFCRAFGYVENEMKGKDESSLFDIINISFEKFLTQRNKKGTVSAQLTCIKKSGDAFPCKISSVVYKSDKGENRIMSTLEILKN